MTILTINQLTKKFKGLVAVSKVDLEINQGDIVGLIGPNGAGKTTLFHSICGFHIPESGSIIFKGKKIKGLKPETICKMGIAKTFQVVQPFGNMTVTENIMIGAFSRVRTTEEAVEIAQKYLRMVGLKHKADIRMDNLSFSEQKKVELARALATQPELLFLDEVMSGLTPSEVKEMIALVRNISKSGITIVFIEHLMSAVMSLSDRVIVMHHGKKIADGQPEEVVKNEDVIEAYLGGVI